MLLSSLQELASDNQGKIDVNASIEHASDNRRKIVIQIAKGELH